MITGTNHFNSFGDAVAYYKIYEYPISRSELEKLIKAKVEEGDIVIACPYDPENDYFLNREEGRWFMREPKPVTGKYTYKPYECTYCGFEKEMGTNHWGDCYPQCPHCGNMVFKCNEPVPVGYGTPEKWKFLKLGSICTITPGKRLPKNGKGGLMRK